MSAQHGHQPRGIARPLAVALAAAAVIVAGGLGVIYAVVRDGGASHAPGADAGMSASAGQMTAWDARSLPSFITGASGDVQTAYRFAFEHPDVLVWMPCYCGCGGQAGHRHNRDCFVKPGGAASLTFEEHGSDCTICVDIALDAKAMTEQGKPLRAIRAAIDAKYASIAPGTDTPLPPE